MSERRAGTKSGGLAGHLAVSICVGTAAAGLLTLWNLLQMLLASRAYRQDPLRTGELLVVSLLAYAPLTIAPIAAFAIGRWVCLKVRPAGAGEGATRDSGASIPTYVGVGVSIATLLFAVGAIAQHNLSELASGRTALLDITLAVLVVICCGAAASWFVVAGLESAAAARRVMLVSGALAAPPVSLTLWEVVQDRSGNHHGAFWNPVVAIGSLVAGTIAIFLALRGISAGLRALRWIQGQRLSDGWKRALPIVIGVLLLTLAGGAAWTHLTATSNGGTTKPGRLNIVLVVADTLRDDHVGAKRAGGSLTPSIDRLAEKGARYTRFYATSAWTAPATASILTGLYPGSHGLITYRDHVRESATSLATVLRRAGYRTAGFSGNPILSARYGFGAGFDRWSEELDAGRLQHHRASPIYATLSFLGLWAPADHFPRAGQVVDRGCAWLDETRDRPFFLYLHLMDTHDPYAPPPPYDSIHGDASASDFVMRIGSLASIMDGLQPIGEPELKRMRDLYDGAVSYVDAQVGRLKEELRRRGLADDTLIVFTADHGEEFLEHGDLEHTRTLYDEIVRIPLVVAGPGIAGGRTITAPAGQIDLAPTLLEAAGLQFPAPVEGRSLWGELSRMEPRPPRDIFMELSYPGLRSPWHSLLAMTRGDFKLIGASPNPGRNGPWSWTLHDLSRGSETVVDPERIDQRAFAEMRSSLLAWSRRPRAIGAAFTNLYDEETEARLRALGYID